MSATYVTIGDAARVVADWRRGAGGVSAFTVARNYALKHGEAVVLKADGSGVFIKRVTPGDPGDRITISKRTVKDVRPVRR
jgi:hypothetical protein